MHAGRGDLPGFLDAIASGALTGTPPRDFVVLLQEDVEAVDRGAIPVARIRGLTAVFAPVHQETGRSSGNAILSTQPLHDPHEIALPRVRQPRTALVGSLEIAGERLFVVNVHLENRVAWWRGLFSDTARGRQAEALLMMLPGPAHGILGGDLNTWLGPREPAWRAMLRRFPSNPTDPRQPTFHDRLVLDHLFFDLPAGWTVTRRVSADTFGSDHHPVVAQISRQ